MNSVLTIQLVQYMMQGNTIHMYVMDTSDVILMLPHSSGVGYCQTGGGLWLVYAHRHL